MISNRATVGALPGTVRDARVDVKRVASAPRPHSHSPRSSLVRARPRAQGSEVVGSSPTGVAISFSLAEKQPFAMSGQLAEIVRGLRFLFSRIICGFQCPPRTPTDRLEAFGSVVRLPLHGQQQTMRRLDWLSINEGQFVQ